jgi:mono/diheme cytochrome c family protein
MSLHSRLWVAPVVLAAVLMSGCGLSLAGDVTPPPNYIAPTAHPVDTPADAKPASQQTVFPLVPPDPVQGAAIYAEKCLPCHGERGMGDGPQAGNLPNPAAPIGSQELARKSRPVDWFQMVTVGNLQKFMPGFSESLNDRQRWDVISYTLMLSVSEEDIRQGKAAYEQNCATCHGASGEGDGAQAASLATRPAAWKREQSRLARLSADDIVTVTGGGEAEHPTFAGALDTAKQYQVAAYVRTLGFSSSGQPVETVLSTKESGEGSPAVTPQATGEAVGMASQTITITGQVTNGTQGGKVPEGLKVNLRGFQGMQDILNLTAEVGADGGYVLKNVPFQTDYIYIAQVDANGLVYNSDVLHGTDVSGAEASLPLEIFETIMDPSVLLIDRLHVFLDFSQPGLVQVVNLYVISNPTDRVVIAESREKPVVEFDVPRGASNLQFQDGQLGDGRYVQTENGFGDTQAVIPGTGQYQVLFAYEMMYDRKLDIPLKAPLPVDAAIVMLPPVGVKLNSDRLASAGQRDVEGLSFQMYQLTGSMKQGDTLNLTLSGKARTDASATADGNSLSPLFVGIGIFGLAMIGTGIWLYTQRKTLEPAAVDVTKATESPVDEPIESSETILDAILALDDLHGSGKLPESAYQDRRAALKAALAKALEREKKP